MGWSNRRTSGGSSNAVLFVILLLGALFACKKKVSGLPADVPVYPGANLKSTSSVLSIRNVMHQSSDDGAKVKAWYDAQLPGGWTSRCGAWRQRQQMLGMTFENRCFKSNSRKEYLQIEVASKPGAPTTIRTRSCPGNRIDRCSGKP